MTESRPERRSGSLEPAKVGIYSPGIARIERIVADRYAQNDAKWSEEDDERYNTLRSDLNHCARVQNASMDIARKFGWPEERIRVVGTGGLMHDFSKVNQACREYRERRRWSEEEKLEFRDKHQRISEQDVLSLSSHVRATDGLYITFVSLIAGNHHDWERVPVYDSRMNCLVVNMADAYLTMQEGDRLYQSGLSQFEAVEKLELDVVVMIRKPKYKPHAESIVRCLSAISELYGPNSVIPIR